LLDKPLNKSNAGSVQWVSSNRRLRAAVLSLLVLTVSFWLAGSDSIWREFNPESMGAAEARARAVV
jgi:hypothetical protein